MNTRSFSVLRVSIGLGLLSVTAAEQREPALAQTDVPDKLENFAPVTDDMLLRSNPENWISFRNGYSQMRSSSLNQIDAANVGELRLVWARAMQAGPQEVEPIVYNGVMFLVNVEDIVQAVRRDERRSPVGIQAPAAARHLKLDGDAIPIPERGDL